MVESVQNCLEYICYFSSTLIEHLVNAKHSAGVLHMQNYFRQIKELTTWVWKWVGLGGKDNNANEVGKYIC